MNIKNLVVFTCIFFNVIVQAQSEDKFWKAIYSGNATQVNALLVGGFNANLRDSAGFTPLMVAVRNQHIGIVRVLLHHKIYPYVQDKNGWTALHWASTSSTNLEIVKIFMKNGIFPLTKTKTGKSVVAIADSSGAEDLLPLLRQQLDADLNRAVTEESKEKIQEYIDAGSDINNDKHGITRQTPLHAAVWTNRIDITALLIAKNAKIDVQDRNGNTPLHLAAMRGDSHLAVLQLLLDKGAVQYNNKSNLSPLQLARRLGHTQIAQVLAPANQK
jgi:uncharacterized protein